MAQNTPANILDMYGGSCPADGWEVMHVATIASSELSKCGYDRIKGRALQRLLKGRKDKPHGHQQLFFSELVKRNLRLDVELRAHTQVAPSTVTSQSPLRS